MCNSSISVRLRTSWPRNIVMKEGPFMSVVSTISLYKFRQYDTKTGLQCFIQVIADFLGCKDAEFSIIRHYSDLDVVLGHLPLIALSQRQ